MNTSDKKSYNNLIYIWEYKENKKIMYLLYHKVYIMVYLRHNVCIKRRELIKALFPLNCNKSNILNNNF